MMVKKYHNDQIKVASFTDHHDLPFTMIYRAVRFTADHPELTRIFGRRIFINLRAKSDLIYFTVRLFYPNFPFT